MEANRKEVDPFDQELEGSPIAGEIPSVNHTTPSPSAPPIQGRVQLSDDQRRESKKAADKRYNEKRRRNEAELKNEQETLKECYAELKSENGELRDLRDRTKALVDEENKKIHSQLGDNNYAGKNTEVQKARINKIGEMSTGQDALNELREVNQAPFTSNADTISGKNASMNLQTLPRSAQPAGSSGLADDKQARKRMAEKKCRDKKKCKLDEAAERIKELKEKNEKLKADNAVLKAEANQSEEHLNQLRNISEKMAFSARKIAMLEKDLDVLKQEIEDTKRQLENLRADYAELKKTYDELGKTHAHSEGKLDQAQKDWEPITRGYRELQQIVERQNAWIDMHQQHLNNQFGATMESEGPVFEESLPLSHQVEPTHWNNVDQSAINYGHLTHGGDVFGNVDISCLETSMASLAPIRQLEAGAGFVTRETGFHDHSPLIYQPRATVDPRGLVIEGSLSQSHQAERENHSWGITPGCAFNTWESRATVHHQPVDSSGTTIRPGGSME